MSGRDDRRKRARVAVARREDAAPAPMDAVALSLVVWLCILVAVQFAMRMPGVDALTISAPPPVSAGMF